MSLWEAIILGIVQGLTEFLPVSSSGHLEIVKVLMGNQSMPEESLLMTVVFHDIHRDVDHKIAPYIGNVFPHWELLYADDTMVMGSRAREINIILKAIEIESEKYNLRLNKGKCFYVGMNGTANIHFKDGKKGSKADTVTYLGGTITSDSSRNAEISSRMSKALATCYKLKTFWLSFSKLTSKHPFAYVFFEFN